MAGSIAVVLPPGEGDVFRDQLDPFVCGVIQLLAESAAAVGAIRDAIHGRGNPALFDPQVRDTACQTRACLILRILRNPPPAEWIDALLKEIQRKRNGVKTAEYYHADMGRNKSEKLEAFCKRHDLHLFDGEDTYRAQIFRFIIVSYILTKYKRSYYHKGVYKDTLTQDVPKWKAVLLKRLQHWLSSFSVDFIALHVPMAARLAVRKNKLTVLPCYLTAMALASIWDREPHSNPMIMKLTVRRFCQQASQHGYHDHDSFYAWSAGGVRRLEAEEVANGQQVIQFFSVSAKGDVSVLEKIRTKLLAPCEEGGAYDQCARSAPIGVVGAAQGGIPCAHGSSCIDFLEWKSRMLGVDFREVFFTVCATHPQYPDSHTTKTSQEWIDMCEQHAPEVFNSFLASLERKDRLACHRGNLNLFMYEHITAAVHRT